MQRMYAKVYAVKKEVVLLKAKIKKIEIEK